MNSRVRGAFTIFVVGLVVGCGGSTNTEPLPQSNGEGPAPFDPGTTYAPDVSAADLSPDITNTLFPGPVGATWTYEAETTDGMERIEVAVEEETRDVWDTTVRVIRDTVYVDDEVIEDTWDWFAQDGDGNVWYMGEETYEYEKGEVVCECGAWESGVDGALPGIIMLDEPNVGAVYRQEFYAGEAEDLGEVVSTNESVTVPAGSWTGCIKTRERSAVELSADAFKYYCPGIGCVLEEEEGERVELIDFSGLEPE